MVIRVATASAAARSFLRSTPVHNFATGLTSKFKPSHFRSASPKPLSHRIFRRPVELSVFLESMQPFHTATASSLMISNLTVSRCGYGWLFEDM